MRTAGALVHVSSSSFVISPRLVQMMLSSLSTHTHGSWPLIQPSGKGFGHVGSIVKRGAFFVATIPMLTSVVTAAIEVLCVVDTRRWTGSLLRVGYTYECDLVLLLTQVKDSAVH